MAGSAGTNPGATVAPNPQQAPTQTAAASQPPAPAGDLSIWGYAPDSTLLANFFHSPSGGRNDHNNLSPAGR